MSSPLPDLDALSLDGLKRLVAQLLARMAALEEENRRLRDENARLKDLPKRPKLAPGGMDRATGPDRQGAQAGGRAGPGGPQGGGGGGGGGPAAAGARSPPPRSGSSRSRRRRARGAGAT